MKKARKIWNDTGIPMKTALNLMKDATEIRIGKEMALKVQSGMIEQARDAWREMPIEDRINTLASIIKTLAKNVPEIERMVNEGTDPGSLMDETVADAVLFHVSKEFIN
jgi:hypothetical protein